MDLEYWKGWVRTGTWAHYVIPPDVGVLQLCLDGPGSGGLRSRDRSPTQGCGTGQSRGCCIANVSIAPPLTGLEERAGALVDSVSLWPWLPYCPRTYSGLTSYKKRVRQSVKIAIGEPGNIFSKLCQIRLEIILVSNR